MLLTSSVFIEFFFGGVLSMTGFRLWEFNDERQIRDSALSEFVGATAG